MILCIHFQEQRQSFELSRMGRIQMREDLSLRPHYFRTIEKTQCFHVTTTEEQCIPIPIVVQSSLIHLSIVILGEDIQ